jgi:hypothetical protein
MKKIVLILALLLAVSVGVNVWQHYSTDKVPVIVISRDTVRDTIRMDVPVAVTQHTIRHDTVTLLVVKVDTVHGDSVRVQLPVTQKTYTDSTYTAWVSGYLPQLDSIEIYRKSIIITNRPITSPYKRFNMGIQVGYGYGLLYKGIEPYIGVGMTLNIK